MSVTGRSRLEAVIANGHFALTVEVGPPRGPDGAEVRRKAALLRGVADAYNVTDNQTAVVRLSSIAASAILREEGLEPVMQMTCRDRNRIGLQSDLLGAWALGIRNCLCLSGDHQRASAHGKLKGHPGAKNVYDVDSIQLLAIARAMGEEGLLESGDPLTQPAPFLLGAAWTPLAPPTAFRVHRLAKKVEAGARFIQTQAVYHVSAFGEAMAMAKERGITDRTAILVGVIVPTSARMLTYMNDNVPGVEVPEELIRRMKQAKDRRAEGLRIAVELIEAIREIPGVRGIHLQAIEAEERLPEVIQAAGLLPRPVLEAPLEHAEHED